MTSEDENSLAEAEARLRKLIPKHSLSPEEQARRKRAQQRLKEAYSSIPWYRERGERDGDRFWESLHDKAALSD